jgi:hypothetical protein
VRAAVVEPAGQGDQSSTHRSVDCHVRHDGMERIELSLLKLLASGACGR